MKKRIGFFAFTLGMSVFGSAQQDKHFSMFAESPVYMNPAAAGFSPGNLQLFSNFRTQWTSVSDNPYKTTTVSADWRMMDNGNFIGAGINFLNDLSGDGKYKINEISVPMNYAVKLKKNQQLSIGLQPGWYQRSLFNTDLTWDNQWTGSNFNTSINNNEALLTDNMTVNRFDMSAGAYWYATLSKKSKLSLGFSASHLSGQKINFMTEENRLYRKLIFHGQYSHKVNDDIFIIPSFYTFFQGPNKEITLGSNFRYSLNKSSDYFEQRAISLGLYYRTGDALMINLIFDIAGFSVGASYDLNISQLNVATNGYGALEFFLRYRFKNKK